MKRIIKSIVAVCLSAVTCIAVSACGGKKTDTAVPPDENGSYSIITKLDLKVEFDGDAAAAKVKNTFTLFPATARVQAYLYYSETETNSYAEMTEVATEYIEDLNLGKTLTASWDTKGRGGYFRARMRYKIDNREWEERVTGQYRRDYTKPVLEPIPDDGSLPVFEDVEPIYQYDMRNNEAIFYYDSFVVKYDGKEVYTQFANEYGKNFNGPLEAEYYIFNLKPVEYYAWANWVHYGLYKDNDKYFLGHNILLNISDFGYGFEIPDPLPPTGLGIWNIGLSFTFINVEEMNLKGLLNLQFGEIVHKGDLQKFINIFIGDFCIGTCFYNAKTVKEISYAFFYNLFADSLIKNLDV